MQTNLKNMVLLYFLLLIHSVISQLYFPDKLSSLPTMSELTRKYNLPSTLTDLKVITHDKETVHLYYILHPNATHLLLLFQSNAGAFIDRLQLLKQFYNRLNVHVGVLSYRGFGVSTGKPTEDGLTDDAVSVLDALSATIPLNNITLLGRSLGVGVALSAAQRRGVSKLILENGFSSLKEFRKVDTKDRWDNLSKFETINKSIKILFLESMNDEIVDNRMTEKMFNHSVNKGFDAKIERFEGARHMSLPSFLKYYEVIGEFLKEK
ncbi:protein bem46, putative [Entamoeba invadens IP1]|uniref:Protein bem46, putative n=1 Tax=Entamoeba invadens IP1 TaxID=370355 RepID=A0A0A1UH39_ENTIV|nr:protein bem46, putative [Entamoeba invadens IP1]ELP94618.1 protein bem46, putative [Entamoeba invadens IP1]|eukprot:XP_004261389.1 protein bem46, putative [Entamoeba invadens IP1]